MLCDTQASIATIAPKKRVENGQDGMTILHWSKMFLTAFSCIKIQICLTKHIKSKNSLASRGIFSDKV